MIRIRFHGRGGHGVKTASRILGSAAFLAGREVQDSPIYGAERRGAPVAAFTRISDGPILERGVIDQPDLIVVADASLMKDDAASVLAGQEHAAAIFVNCPHPDTVSGGIGEQPQLITWDITGAMMKRWGSPSALSAGLAAVAARLLGFISAEDLLQAARDELTEIGVSKDALRPNLEIARDVFAALPALNLMPRELPATGDCMAHISYDGPVRGAPGIHHPGNAALRHTGNWRVERPIIDREACTRCGLCFVQCPDGAIALDPKGYPLIDYDHCKGCLICREVCPLEAIHVEKEALA